MDVTHLPYRGSGPGVIAVMSGEASFMMPATPSALPGIKNGKVRALAVTGPKRHPDFPDVPTIADTFPGYDVTSWYGLSAPAGTPQPIIEQLSDALRKALANPEASRRSPTPAWSRSSHAGGVRRIHQGGNREVDQGHARRQCEA